MGLPLQERLFHEEVTFTGWNLGVGTSFFDRCMLKVEETVATQGVLYNLNYTGPALEQAVFVISWEINSEIGAVIKSCII